MVSLSNNGLTVTLVYGAEEQELWLSPKLEFSYENFNYTEKKPMQTVGVAVISQQLQRSFRLEISHWIGPITETFLLQFQVLPL